MKVSCPLCGRSFDTTDAGEERIKQHRDIQCPYCFGYLTISKHSKPRYKLGSRVLQKVI
jgi:DNA-directed RNA polymerase subunit RPC12/RpoP